MFNSSGGHAKRVRRDETRFGALIYATTFEHLDNYIRTHRFPISSGNFVLIVTEPPRRDDWMGDGSRIMAFLWKNYKILYAFLIVACQSNGVGYYDPFYSKNRRWGAMRWSHIEDVNYRNGWILSVADDFNQYPVRLGLFERYPTMVTATTFPATYLQSYFADGIQYSNGYAGFDGLLVGNLAKGFNFRSRTMYTNRYGDFLPNKTFTGLAFKIPENRLDSTIFFRCNW